MRCNRVTKRSAERAPKNRRESAQTLRALAIIDNLAPGAAMHLARPAAQIVNYQSRPVFTVAVRQDPIGGLPPLDANDWLANRLHAANGLHRHRSPGMVLHFDLNGSVGALIVKLDRVDQVGLALEPGGSNADLMAGAQGVAERRLGGAMLRILIRPYPLVVDLRSRTGAQHRTARCRARC